jgi:hypothetical protein
MSSAILTYHRGQKARARERHELLVFGKHLKVCGSCSPRQQVATTRVNAVTAARLFGEAGVKTTIAMPLLPRQKKNEQQSRTQGMYRANREPGLQNGDIR